MTYLEPCERPGSTIRKDIECVAHASWKCSANLARGSSLLLRLVIAKHSHLALPFRYAHLINDWMHLHFLIVILHGCRGTIRGKKVRCSHESDMTRCSVLPEVSGACSHTLGERLVRGKDSKDPATGRVPSWVKTYPRVPEIKIFCSCLTTRSLSWFHCFHRDGEIAHRIVHK